MIERLRRWWASWREERFREWDCEHCGVIVRDTVQRTDEQWKAWHQANGGCRR